MSTKNGQTQHTIYARLKITRLNVFVITIPAELKVKKWLWQNLIHRFMWSTRINHRRGSTRNEYTNFIRTIGKRAYQVKGDYILNPIGENPSEKEPQYGKW